MVQIKPWRHNSVELGIHYLNQFATIWQKRKIRCIQYIWVIGYRRPYSFTIIQKSKMLMLVIALIVIQNIHCLPFLTTKTRRQADENSQLIISKFHVNTSIQFRLILFSEIILFALLVFNHDNRFDMWVSILEAAINILGQKISHTMSYVQIGFF